ncbi:16425_t:CDS:2 [Funneliformis geosporum]|uniref:16425_t:CDS:1 n=1 Tax=Funneliformis geosporum TaxID=1117311 RepID=A0A9W4WZ85_9GLOM|nr:16425_t:CDS:2 [Funneliformis geosporum]
MFELKEVSREIAHQALKAASYKLPKNNKVTELRQALFMLRLEQRAGRLRQTHQIKKIRKEIAHNLTKQNQARIVKDEASGGKI